MARNDTDSNADDARDLDYPREYNSAGSDHGTVLDEADRPTDADGEDAEADRRD